MESFFHTACNIPVKSLKLIRWLQKFLFQEEKCHEVEHFGLASLGW